ncbi:MAG: hypothetical protein ACLUE2_17060 [Bacteroides cellulosilyticus]
MVASEIEVVYNETAEITVTVEPAEASTDKKVTANFRFFHHRNHRTGRSHIERRR